MRQKLVLLGCAVLLISLDLVGVEQSGPVRLQGATLLSGFGYGNLVVTKSSQTIQVLNANTQNRTHEHPSPTYASISPDGDHVFCALTGSGAPQEAEVASYAVRTKKWTKYASAEHIWAVAASPDMQSLAYVSNDKNGDPPRLHIFDINTGVSSILPVKVAVPSSISWSSNSERLTFQTDLSNELGRLDLAIGVAEVRSGKTTILGEGRSPSWSPSGDWIAYFDPNGTRVLLVHPDGSGQKVLTGSQRSSFGARGQFYFVPVWSPDSRQLLVNEVGDIERLETDVIIYDPMSGKVKQRFRHKTPVLGWAAGQ